MERDGAWAHQVSLAELEPPSECHDVWLRPGPQLYLVPSAGRSELGQQEGGRGTYFTFFP